MHGHQQILDKFLVSLCIETTQQQRVCNDRMSIQCLNVPAAMKPKPPALVTFAASAPEVAPPIGAEMMGVVISVHVCKPSVRYSITVSVDSVLNNSVMRVLIAAMMEVWM